MQETGILNTFLRTTLFYHTQNNKMSTEFKIVNLELKPQAAHGE